MDGIPNPHMHTPGGFVGGFTPHYSPPPSSFQPVYPFPQPPPPSNRYDGMPPLSMDNLQPPPLPPKFANYPYQQPQNHYPPQNIELDPSVSSFPSSSHLQSISSMSAQERSQNLRIAKMKPHLQFMVGPLLRYDTVESGIWRGAALIVSECACLRMHISFPFF